MFRVVVALARLDGHLLISVSHTPNFVTGPYSRDLKQKVCSMDGVSS